MEDILPESYECEAKILEEKIGGNPQHFKAMIYLKKCVTKEDMDRWLRDFEKKSNSKFNIRKTYPKIQKFQYRADYVCKRNKFKTGKAAGTGQDHCEARLSMTIRKETEKTQRSHMIRDGYLAEVLLVWSHNHEILPAATVSDVLASAIRGPDANKDADSEVNPIDVAIASVVKMPDSCEVGGLADSELLHQSNKRLMEENELLFQEKSSLSKEYAALLEESAKKSEEINRLLQSNDRLMATNRILEAKMEDLAKDSVVLAHLTRENRALKEKLGERLEQQRERAKRKLTFTPEKTKKQEARKKKRDDLHNVDDALERFHNA